MIKTLAEEDKEAAVGILVKCFEGDGYYEKCSLQDLNDMFSEGYDIMVGSGMSKGYFSENWPMLGVLIAFNYNMLLETDPIGFASLFKASNSGTEEAVDETKAMLDGLDCEKLIYMPLLAVSECARGKGIATELVKSIMFGEFDIATDASSKITERICSSLGWSKICSGKYSALLEYKQN